MAEEVKDTVQTEPQENKEGKETKEQGTKIDVEKVKSEALAGFLKELGVEDKDSLKGIITKAREEENKNKTELERRNDTLIQTTKELSSERELRIMAEAKLSAIQLGAKAELVDDLVVVAKSKVTKDKDISTVISEMKESDSGKVYFKNDEEDSENEESKTLTVTRARVKKVEEKTDKKETKETKHYGSMAERLLKNRKETKHHYFSN